MKKILFILILMIAVLLNSEILFPGVTGEALIDSIIANYKSYSNLGYDDGRDTLYGVIDNHNDSLTGVYTGFTMYIDPSQDPSVAAYDNNRGINCEHTWPKNYGADNGIQESDLHHLYPTRVSVNGDRGHLPFDEINDNYTDDWYWMDQESSTMPTSNIDEWSERDVNSAFEPREDHKGNTARSMYYFYTMYRSNYIAVDPDESWWNRQKDVLFQWHYDDPVDSREENRTNAIASYQEGKPNPFIIDTTLIRRSYYPHLGIDEIHADVSSIEIAYSARGIRITESRSKGFTVDIYSINGSPLMQRTGSGNMLINIRHFTVSGKYILIVRQDQATISRIITILK